MRSWVQLVLLFGFNFFISNEAQAWIGSRHLFLGAGAMFYNVGKTTSSNDASTSMLGQLYLPLTLTVRIPVTPFLNLQPNISYTPLAVTEADSVSKKILMTGLNLGFRKIPLVDLKAGVGILNYSISGDGSTVTRSNGTSTSTFTLPDSTVTSKSFYLDFGANWDAPFGFRLDVDAILLNAMTESRAFSTLISLSKGFF